MYLNQFGKIVWLQWYWLEESYPYVILHSFIVMPNHIHGILEINRANLLKNSTEISEHALPAIKVKPFFDLIGAFKMTASKLIRMIEKDNSFNRADKPKFNWHRSFHDHIIRSDRAFGRITRYIENNPANWKNDEFYEKE